jgi:nucleoside-diphosphate-sugar epimerase
MRHSIVSPRVLFVLDLKQNHKNHLNTSEEIYAIQVHTAYGKVKVQLYANLDSIFNDSRVPICVGTRFFRIWTLRHFRLTTHEIDIIQNHKSQLLQLRIQKALWSLLYEDDFADAVERILQNTEIEGVINIGNHNTG